MAIRGATVEERGAARAERTRKNRVKFFAHAIRSACSGREQLARACDYAKAVADELDNAGRFELAKAIAALVDERSRRDHSQ